MRLTRCDACGAKALFAASKCPRCSHLLELRDAGGNPVPVTRCRSCDTYFVSARGRCSWCQTAAAAATPGKSAKPAKATSTVRVAPIAIGLLGIAVLVAATWGAMRSSRGVVVARAAPATKPELAPVVVTPPQLPLDSAVTSPPIELPVVEEPPAPVAAAVARPPDVSQVAPAPPRASRAWVTSTARTLVKVRSQASRRAAVVGIVTPETRVQIGESRAGWLRLRTLGVSGWVERRLFVSDSTTPPR